MSWKDHPIVIAAGTCVATMGVCYKLLIPAYTTTLENQVAKDLTAISELKQISDRARERADRLDQLNKELLSDGIFSNCSPYPRALSKIKVGDRTDKLVEIYGENLITREEDNRWLTLEVNDDPIFSKPTYYFDKETSKINQILFFFNERVDSLHTNATQDPKKESATQISVINQIKRAFPQIDIERNKERSKPEYNASFKGKVIFQIDQNAMLVTRNALNIDSKICAAKN